MSWALLWLATFVVALLAFGLISLLIAVKGVAEIRELFDALGSERRRRS